VHRVDHHTSGRFHANFLWRTTGFPCEALELFSLDVLASDIRSVAGDRNRRKSRGSTYSELLGEVLTRRFNTAFTELRQRLYEVFVSNRFQVAVACSSPAAATVLRNAAGNGAQPRRSRQKRLELLGMRYLQRFVTKCETSAFFGPVATGSLGEVPRRVTFQHHLASYRGSGFISDRLLGRLLDRLRREREVLWHARFRRRSGVAFGPNETIVHPRFGQLQLDKRVCDLVARATVATPVFNLLAGWPDARTEGLMAVLGLLEIGALSDELEAAWYSSDPIKQLRPYLAYSAAAGELTALFEMLDCALAGWPNSDAPGRQNWLDSIACAMSGCGVPEASSHAGFYSDHLPVFEDGFSSGIRLCLDEEWAEPFLLDLETAVRASLARDAARSRVFRKEIARRFDSRRRRPCPLPDFLSELAGIALTLEISQGTDGSNEFSGPVITSPDVLIAAHDLSSLRRRDCAWVLSECHSSVGSAGFFVRPMPDQSGWLADIDSFLVEQLQGSQPVVVAARRSNKTSYLGTLRCARYLEAGLSCPPGTCTIALEELELLPGDDLRLVMRGTKVPVVLIPGGLDEAAPLLECFRTPRFQPLPGISPDGGREAVGRVVYRRARWQLEASDLPDGRADALEVFVWAQGLRELHGLPRWIFARPALERKPLCIDLSNPFLCEELLRLLRSESRLPVEEMYPAPDDAWVHGPEGRYLGELRFLYAAGGSSS
jgi:hypothetical protein